MEMRNRFFDLVGDLLFFHQSSCTLNSQIFTLTASNIQTASLQSSMHRHLYLRATLSLDYWFQPRDNLIHKMKSHNNFMEMSFEKKEDVILCIQELSLLSDAFSDIAC